MFRYSQAPTIITTNRDDLDECTEIHVTFAQGDTLVDKTDSDITISDDKTTLITRLTQAEAAGFAAGKPVSIQVTLLDPDGYRFVSNIVPRPVGDSLLDYEIPEAEEEEEEES